MTNEIGKRLKNLRISKGLTQEDIATKAKITRSTISNYENGRRTPHLKDLQQLAKIFNVGLEYFGVSNIDDAFELLTRARIVFQSEKVPKQTKEELYMEFMRMYLELKEKEGEEN